MAKYYRPTAYAALAVFLALGTLHVAALLRLTVPPMGLTVALAFPLIGIGQLVTIAGFQGGSLRSGSVRLPRSQALRASFIALRHVPFGWKAFGIPFWYGYMPMTFFGRVLGYEGEVERGRDGPVLVYKGRFVRALTEDEALDIRANHFLAMSVILLGFALVHWICLRFIIPRREEILRELESTRPPNPA